ncbi:MAG: phosphoribosyl-AMP cyclohydrolase [Pseudomonadota bacterium]
MSYRKQATHFIRHHAVAGTLGALALVVAGSANAGSFSDHVNKLPSGPEITQADIESAQTGWGNAVVAIGKAGDDAHAMAKEAAVSAYAFELGPIQFKPTLASQEPFRPDLEGTLSYFVSGNDAYPEDKGFALRPWSNVRFDNHHVYMHDNLAIAMGHYYFTGPDGTETKVEYTKGYVKTEDGRVLIFLQDSSLPYSPS